MTKRIETFFILIVLSISITYGQTTEPAKTKVVLASEDARCELNNRFMDALISEATKQNARVFIISRQAKNEKPGINWTRLLYARAVLGDFKGFTKNKITVAVGEISSDKEGLLEFWVGSELFLIAYAAKNQQLCMQVKEY